MKLYFSLKHSKMTTPEGNVEGEVGSALVLKSMCTFTSPKCLFISRIALLFSKNCPFLLQKCPFVSRNCPFVFQKYLSELHFSFTNCLFWISFQLIVRCPRPAQCFSEKKYLPSSCFIFMFQNSLLTTKISSVSFILGRETKSFSVRY